MNGGCGGLWMQIHGHSPAYGVAKFNDNGVWLRKATRDGTKLTGDDLTTAQEQFRTRLVQQLQRKWVAEESELLSAVPDAIVAAEVCCLFSAVH